MSNTPAKASPVEPPAATPQRDAVLRTAARLFREKGFERTTVRDVAKEVGLQSGSLFHHFASKAEILAEVMEYGLTLASDQLNRTILRESSPEARVDALFRGYLNILLSDECRDYMTVLLYDFRSLPPDLARRVHRFRSSLEERWRSVLEEALPPDRDPMQAKLMAQFVFGAMCWALQWYNPKGALSLDELSEQFTEMASATCGVRYTPKNKTRTSGRTGGRARAA